MSKLHSSITRPRIVAAARESMFGLSDEGICTACGESQFGVEPDARNYTCESCGEPCVTGAEELLFEVVA